MAASLWLRSGDTQLRKTVFQPAYSSVKNAGAVSSFFLGGTTTPLIVYRDSGSNESYGSTVEVDANGRWPPVFVPTGNVYKYIITDFDGTIISQIDNIQNPDIGEGGEPPGGAYATGDTIWRPQTGTLSGFVRLNGRTIGSNASGASERAENDTVDLYTLIWNNTTQDTAPVIPVRGASPAADFAADKPLTLFDARSATLAGLDDMGNTAGGFLASTPFTTGDAVMVGSLAGYNAKTVLIAEFENHVHDFGSLGMNQQGLHTHGPGTYAVSSTNSSHSHTINQSNHQHNITDFRTSVSVDVNGDGSTIGVIRASGASSFQSDGAQANVSIPSGGGHSHSFTGTSANSSPATHAHTISGNTGDVGGGGNYNVFQRSILGTHYIKL